MTSRLHPLLAPEVQRWLGEGPLPAELEGLLRSLSLRLEVMDDVREADTAGELEAFFRLSGDLLMVLDATLRVRHLNTAFSALGWEVAECRGRPVGELLADGDRESTEATLRSMLQTHEQVPLSTRVRDGRGGVRVVHWLLTTDAQGQRIYGVGRDVSDQQALEHRLAQAHQLEAIGQLAAGVAHEVNTPLQFLGDNVAFVAESFGDLLPVLSMAERRSDFDPHLKEAVGKVDVAYLRQELPRALEAMADGLKRVGFLVRSLKELAPSDGEALEATEAVDLVPSLRATLGALADNELRDLKVVNELHELPLVRCHVGGITRVFASLLDNAAHAVAARHGGRPGAGEVQASTFVEGSQAVLRVRDNGTGICEQARARIFEPFFTTRDVGQGSGQSLAVARSIVERHQGSISFETELGEGTTFTVRLPLSTGTRAMEPDLWG
jgi:PAS domain S-box-containing protein